MTKSERDVDTQLVTRVQNGDKRAFDLLVLKYQRRIMRLLSRLINNQSDIEDVAQETFIKAYRALPNFRGESAFYTWLYRIAVNTANNWLTSQQRRPQTIDLIKNQQNETFNPIDSLMDVNTPQALLASRQIAETVNQALQDLPPDLRMAITLREIEGLSYQEIAQTMDCPVGTVRSRIFRARDFINTKLRPVLEDESGIR